MKPRRGRVNKMGEDGGGRVKSGGGKRVGEGLMLALTKVLREFH